MTMPPVSPRRRFFSQSAEVKEEEPKGAYAKLPMLKISHILQKIGAGDKKRQMYIPSESDQASFRRSKLDQLSRQYSPQRYTHKPSFEGDLDEITMDCYKYGENNGRQTVWRRYRQNYDDLTFHTLRVMRKNL